jgi:hypothetical protein
MRGDEYMIVILGKRILLLLSKIILDIVLLLHLFAPSTGRTPSIIIMIIAVGAKRRRRRRTFPAEPFFGTRLGWRRRRQGVVIAVNIKGIRVRHYVRGVFLEMSNVSGSHSCIDVPELSGVGRVAGER